MTSRTRDLRNDTASRTGVVSIEGDPLVNQAQTFAQSRGYKFEAFESKESVMDGIVHSAHDRVILLASREQLNESLLEALRAYTFQSEYISERLSAVITANTVSSLGEYLKRLQTPPPTADSHGIVVPFDHCALRNEPGVHLLSSNDANLEKFKELERTALSTLSMITRGLVGCNIQIVN